MRLMPSNEFVHGVLAERLARAEGQLEAAYADLTLAEISKHNAEADIEELVTQIEALRAARHIFADGNEQL